MEIFQLKDNIVTFHPQALTLKPFKALWDRDKTKTKKNAVEDLSFVYFYTDYKSEFSDILEDDLRAIEVQRIVISRDKWEFDEQIKEACMLYDKLQETLSSKLLVSARKGVQKIKDFIESIDLNERDKSNKYVMNPSSLQKTINELGSTVAGLKKLEDIVKKEQAEDSRIRGGGEVGMFEDPDDDLKEVIDGA